MSEEIGNLISLINSIVALIVSVIALIYTVRTYLLKSGSSVRGSYATCSSASCEDKYVSSVTLENLKDRSTVVFSIYLKIGHNYFLEIENFESSPLILKPFEVYRKEYDAIDLYSVSMKRIRLDSLFDNKKVKKQLLLSTSDGRYVVNDNIRMWDPIVDFFKNHFTAVIKINRGTYKGKSYGGNTKFIVDIKLENGKDEVIAIYPRDYEIRRFKDFQLTKESLDSKEQLENFFYEQVGLGNLVCSDLTVHDIESWNQENYNIQHKESFEAEYYNWFTYRVIGSVLTKYDSYRIRCKNKKMMSARKAN
ncbi:hypothetical protein ACFO1C_000575 [Photobacterium damselae]